MTKTNYITGLGRHALLLLACIVAGYGRPAAAAEPQARMTIGSGVAAEKTIALTAIARKLTLELPGRVSVRVERKAAPRVLIRFDRNLLELISVQSDGATVKIGMSASFRSNLELRLDIVLNAMESIENNGSADVAIAQLSEPRLLIDSPGSGNVSAAGRVERLIVRLSGSGDLSAGDLAASACEVSASGSGNASLRCSESVSGELSGAGSLSVAGNPKRRSVRSLGASEIEYE